MEDDKQQDENPWANLSTVNEFDKGLTTSQSENPMEPAKYIQSAEECATTMTKNSIQSEMTKLSSILLPSFINLILERNKDDNNIDVSYFEICDFLHKFKIIDGTYKMSELESLRLPYKISFYKLLDIFKSIIESRTDLPTTEIFFERLSHYKKDFEEIEYIASGGFGQVYKARHKLDGIEYAIKKIPVYSNQLCAIKKNVEEVKTSAKLNHANIVAYKSAWIEPYFQCCAASLPPTEGSDISTSAHSSLLSSNCNDKSKQDEQDTSTNTCTKSPDTCEIIIYKEEEEDSNDCDNSKIFKDDCDQDNNNSKSPSNNVSEKASNEEASNEEFNSEESISEEASSEEDSSEEACSKEISSDESSDDGIIFKDSSDNESDTSQKVSEIKEIDTSNSDSLENIVVKEDKDNTEISDNSLNSNSSLSHTESEEDSKILTKGGNKRKKEAAPIAILYIQMALCKQTLEQWMNETERPTPDHIIKKILVQILNGLEYMHSNKIVHHDIKPTNIYISTDNLTIQLGDFGLACPNYEIPHSTIGGSMLYAAPEQLNGLCTDKSDIYSVGIVLLKLLTQTTMETTIIMNKIKDGSTSHPIISQQWFDLIKRCLKQNPDERPSATDILQEINPSDKDAKIAELEAKIVELELKIAELEKNQIKK